MRPNSATRTIHMHSHQTLFLLRLKGVASETKLGAVSTMVTMRSRHFTRGQEAWRRVWASAVTCRQWSKVQGQKSKFTFKAILDCQKSWPWSKLWTQCLWEWSPPTHTPWIDTTCTCWGGLGNKSILRATPQWGSWHCISNIYLFYRPHPHKGSGNETT